jgi:2-polyprenyl-3-methyl-5-hydroxy-6-metoxy-1,4-benzoquinol methylase
MSFDVDIVIMSNFNKQFTPDIEVLVGLPTKNPWSLPFTHKRLFAERAERYDLFVYSEDDILITENNLRAFLDASTVLQEDELAGYLRIERGPNGAVNYPDIHGYHHWDPTSLRTRGRYTLARFTNEHAACYVLTRNQLKKAIKSGGFLVEPHEWKHDLLCTAATDPYIQCGFTKLIPISHLDAFTVHHLSNKYIERMGIDGATLRLQLETMLRLNTKKGKIAPLLATDTNLWRGMYSKDYYEPLRKEVISMIPPTASRVLSIGCGSGATEGWLANRGVQVVAVPLDPIIGSTVAARGVEVVCGDFRTAKQQLRNDRFDCLLYLNVLHLVYDPVDVLSMFKDVLSDQSTVIIETPNMLCGPAIWREFRTPKLRKLRNESPRARWSDKATGVNFTFPGKVYYWCRSAGLKPKSTTAILHPRAESIFNRSPSVVRGFIPNCIKLLLAPTSITIAHKADMRLTATPGDRTKVTSLCNGNEDDKSANAESWPSVGPRGSVKPAISELVEPTKSSRDAREITLGNL